MVNYTYGRQWGKLKLYCFMSHEVYYQGENPIDENCKITEWHFDPVTYTTWDNDFQSVVHICNNDKVKIGDADGYHKQIAFIEVDIDEFLIKYDIEKFDLDNESVQECLSYYVDYGYTFIYDELFTHEAIETV